jgi:hypothetical protein
MLQIQILSSAINVLPRTQCLQFIKLTGLFLIVYLSVLKLEIVLSMRPCKMEDINATSAHNLQILAVRFSL